ncbi:MAG TPA: amidase family protein [Caulobacteraceae bacterium]|jgi:amidase
MSHILDQDATDQLAALDKRRVSAEEILEAAIIRAEAVDPKLNALAARDLDRARQRARTIDEQRARGEPPGRLAGLPMTIKDVLDVEGMPASSGVRENLKRIAGDAAAVARVRAQGAVIWAKTNAAPGASDWQTFNDLYGTTKNPWAPERTSGGSSGGAAAALAARLTPLEVGSDNAGSLRVPASFCGVLAHQPTYGLVPLRGHVPPDPGSLSEPDLNVIGPMARSVRDLRLLLSVLSSGQVPHEGRPEDLSELKAALWLDDPAFFIDGAVKDALKRFGMALEAEGAKVHPVNSPIDGEELLEVYVWLLYSLPTGASGPWTRVRNEVKRPFAKLAMSAGADPQSWALCTLAATARHREWLEADEARREFRRRMKAFFDRWDILVMPAAPVPPFPHDHRPRGKRKLQTADGRSAPYDAMVHWSALATVCGFPSVTLPTGVVDGLPIGVQIVGPADGDARLLSIAQGIEERLGGYERPPEF